MKRTSFATCFLGLAGMAQAQTVVMDQIGPNDCSGVGGSAHASQDFEAAYDGYDVAVLDNFTMPAGTIISVEAVIGGWNGYTGPSPITGYNVEIYSDSANACTDLMGDVASVFVDAADAVINPDWTCNAGVFQALVLLNVNIPLAAGDYWVGVWPANEFAANGQCGVDTSTLGDGISGVQANPNGGFGMPGNCQDTAADMAFRVTMEGGDPPDPCDDPVGDCAADLDGDLLVTVNDLLMLLAHWGECGDGTYRPVGDIDGDCCVTVSDLLLLLAAWGGDCNVYGACCLPDESCTETTPDGCADAGGTYSGDGTACADIACVVSCDEGVGCQLPDQAGHGADGIIGATSDLNPGFKVADTLRPIADGSISSVCWWGMYIDFGGPTDCGIDSPGDSNDFSITYYNDGGTLPGTVLAGPYAVSASMAPTGNVIPSSIGDIIEWQYEASHEPVAVMAGECYWIEITNNTTGTCYWLWETAPPGDGRSAQDNGGYAASDYDLAFCVNIETADDGCGAAAGACCLPDDTCSEMTAADCKAAGGVYNGDYVTCEDVNDCQAVYGACCVDEVTCVDDLDELDCIDFGGTFMGGGTLCSDVSCEVTAPSALDQIGADDGSDLGTGIFASQDFEAAYDAYDIAVVEDFGFKAATSLVSIEAVINGWNGYVGPDPITGYTVSVYSTIDAAGGDLNGDVFVQDFTSATFPTWTGPGTLVFFDVDVSLAEGTYYFAVIPWNEFGVNGQTGIQGSNLGDGTMWQANPNGGFGFGPYQEASDNAAYRLSPATP